MPLGPQNSSLRLRARSRVAEAMEQLEAIDCIDMDRTSSSTDTARGTSETFYRMFNS